MEWIKAYERTNCEKFICSDCRNVVYWAHSKGKVNECKYPNCPYCKAKMKGAEMSYWNNISKIEAKQTEKGIKEYGQTLEQNQVPSAIERISYIEEELVDALKYLEWLKDSLNQLTSNLEADDGK